MSLQVQHLTKWYGRQRAVHDISFEVGRGEIVGFLGPNGAGKSTTLKIATGYLPPSSGHVIVSGHDVVSDPLAVKRIVGYLPEHNPMYLDMYVHEYLQFVGKLFGLKNAKTRVQDMVDLCGLSREQHKKIEALSKGYRQRVGLAQALLHDPEVLILDEPTSGLDPNQIVEIRSLIKSISQDKTVIFSTHIMQEVQALCDRVIVIHSGEIVADDRLDHLLQMKRRDAAVVVELDTSIELSAWDSLADIEEVTHLDGFRYRLLPKSGADIRPAVFQFAAQRNIVLLGLKVEENSIEQIFKELTHHEPVS